MLRLGALIGGCVVGALMLAAPGDAQQASSQSALATDMRISNLEDQMRDLTGQVQELNHDIQEVKQQLDRLSSDVDLRFSQLQGGAPAPGAPANAGPPQRKPSPGAGELGRAPARSGALGTLAAPAPGRSGTAEAPRQQTAAAAGALPEGSAQDQYNYAMGLLTQANYPAAEQAMRAFIAHFPKDPLAGNAQYWLGETYYVRKDYANAATAYAQGYEKYPHGAKAADDLLKLGMSLDNLGQKADACKAYARLEHDFPAAAPALKERLVSEKRRAGC